MAGRPRFKYVNGRAPEDALARFEAYLRQRHADSPENRSVRERAAVDNYERANNVVLASAEAKLNGNRFTCRMEIPARLPWPPGGDSSICQNYKRIGSRSDQPASESMMSRTKRL